MASVEDDRRKQEGRQEPIDSTVGASDEGWSGAVTGMTPAGQDAFDAEESGGRANPRPGGMGSDGDPVESLGGMGSDSDMTDHLGGMGSDGDPPETLGGMGSDGDVTDHLGGMGSDGDASVDDALEEGVEWTSDADVVGGASRMADIEGIGGTVIDDAPTGGTTGTTSGEGGWNSGDGGNTEGVVDVEDTAESSGSSGMDE